MARREVLQSSIRSALQAADIYTKGFTIPSEWDRVTRLINVIDRARFWEGDDAAEARPGHMPEEDKGGVIFGYRTPNPWQGRESMTIPDPEIDPEGVPAAACTIPCSAPPNPDTHIPWFVAAPCCKSRGVDKEIADRDSGNLSVMQRKIIPYRFPLLVLSQISSFRLLLLLLIQQVIVARCAEVAAFSLASSCVVAHLRPALWCLKRR